MLLKISENLQENTSTGVSFLSVANNFMKKRDSGTCIFLWILWNLLKHPFLLTSSGDCFFLSQDINHKVFLFTIYGIGIPLTKEIYQKHGDITK